VQVPRAPHRRYSKQGKEVLGRSTTTLILYETTHDSEIQSCLSQLFVYSTATSSRAPVVGLVRSGSSSIRCLGSVTSSERRKIDVF